MSASLVGSEMCIRDSSLTLAANEATSCAGASGCCSRAGRCRGAASATVSYTHLTLPTICSV
eukprot:3607194-Alexandrium_andersonii.AAC.1